MSLVVERHQFVSCFVPACPIESVSLSPETHMALLAGLESAPAGNG